MAIKVSGTTVINDSRQLQNIATLDSTTAATISGAAGLPVIGLGTGGTITTDGDYKVHTFTSSGTFTVTVAGQFEVLVVGGGGSGGKAYNNNAGGGGGAGGFKTQFFNLSKINGANTAYTCTVGAGAVGVASNFVRGGDSSFIGPEAFLTATGGGYGIKSSLNYAGGDGGSGGGGGGDTGSFAGGRSVAGEGFAGGLNYGDGGGGGGGASAAGQTPPTADEGGNGGNGKASSITGTSVTYAGGGGGGGASTSGSQGAGGTGGGGAGGYATLIGVNGTANTGGGGGGSGRFQAVTVPASGGSGVVIVRYKFQ